MQLTTDRLIIKLVTADDLEDIHALHSIPEVDQYNTAGIPESIAVTKAWIGEWLVEHQKEKVEKYFLAVFLKNHQTFIGMMGLKLSAAKYNSGEIWYKFLPAHWGSGYATEAAKKLIRFGFEDLKLHRIEAGCAVENIGSVRVLEKAGMTLEGRKRQTLPLKTGWADNFEYGILSTD
ncbi:GNAT family N-acetyltransferase [Taibaiella soli]|uniref:N-acetyltransferase n=1 Tax=Taibaiella soli TaxID=1649169 RepID=A0A2W2B267_9BACT|nr:GNAT family N-acetyltransferase [Taibaiella soli]PZF74364.1 N-acetyltransferase [Taibaiella soli]